MIIVFGKNGQLARTLKAKQPPNLKVEYIGSNELDICNVDKLKFLLNRKKPALIINTAAFTNVDEAETEVKFAEILNADAPKVMADFCYNNQSRMLHISTDFVFDGSSSYVKENFESNPINIYGKTKKMGEEYIIASKTDYVILRTSWLVSKYTGNFLTKILGLASSLENLNIVNDQYGTPTTTNYLAEKVWAITFQNNFPQGIYHCALDGRVSRLQFARFIIETAREMGFPIYVKPQDILPISSEDYITKAYRPRDTSLNSDKILNLLNNNKKHWKTEIFRLIKQIKDERLFDENYKK